MSNQSLNGTVDGSDGRDLHKQEEDTAIEEAGVHENVRCFSGWDERRPFGEGKRNISSEEERTRGVRRGFFEGEIESAGDGEHEEFVEYEKEFLSFGKEIFLFEFGFFVPPTPTSW